MRCRDGADAEFSLRNYATRTDYLAAAAAVTKLWKDHRRCTDQGECIELAKLDAFLTTVTSVVGENGDGEADIDRQQDKKACKGSRKSALPFDLSGLLL